MSFLDRIRPPHRPGLRNSDETRRWAADQFPRSHQQIAATVAGILCEQTGALFSELKASTHFMNDMGVFDAFDTVDFSTEIQHEFRIVIPEQDLAKMHRISDVIEYLYEGKRAPLSDAEFCSRLRVRSELLRFVAASREALARVCRVSASSFYPDDKPAAALKLLTFDWDDAGVTMELEHILGITITDAIPRFLGWRFFWRGEPGPQTIGEWCVRVAEHLQSRNSESHVR